jgi:hypothetical protein
MLAPADVLMIGSWRRREMTVPSHFQKTCRKKRRRRAARWPMRRASSTAYTMKQKLRII